MVPAGIHLSAHGITSGPLWDRVTRSILNMEGDEHRRLRSLVSRAFTPRATARMHDTIHAVINELIDSVIDSGRCEFVADIARPYPIPVICALLGAPREDWQQFSRWAEDIFKIVSFDCNLAEEEPVVLKAWGEFDDYIDGDGRPTSTALDRRSALRAHPHRRRRRAARRRRIAHVGVQHSGGRNRHHPKPVGRFDAGALRSPRAVLCLYFVDVLLGLSATALVMPGIPAQELSRLVREKH